MRSVFKIGAPVVAAALALSACGGTSGGGSGSAGGGGKACDLKIGFFGALTGDAANLGINIKNGAELAVNQYNEKHSDCKVTLVSFDSQGDPAIAPGLAQKAVTDKKLVGIVGPAFSGESKAADPIFDKAGLNIITASATNPALAENGWKTFHRILGNDATQGPAAAKYMKDILKAQKVFVSDDTSEYGKGLADIVKKDLGSLVVGTDETAADGKQDDFSPTVTKAKASGATAFFYGGYYSNASKLVKQLKDGGFTGTFVAADGVKDDGFIKGAGQAAEGAILTCPCLPPDKAPDFAAAYKKAYNSDPATYSAEAFDAANVFLDAIAAGKTSSSDMNSFIASYDKQGVTKKVKFDSKGEPAEVSVWAYKVSGGKIVPDQEIK
ncbi:branched-chain amino acid ABC transporter substrate-binding protein [Phycicoccus sp. M110.8]|uniref:branched-chain amino acid ABC transporter substrate-binding protein n=1 Tax=Phycicoccus sp. M110.8 TaxID=3075433 RepID=UPI0028FD3916|nr:branched-chain amino acid ABC transporter substrate-binding protein [Phycicoccus sp. M110.8]MDU0315832.1 branched-chain amino acid ABC transporter substrate-binding protein [Phycicoccus sp. M110.8]